MTRLATISRNKLNLFLDLGLALTFAVVMEERFTGIHIHELLGLAIAVALVTHILLHWRWVVDVTRRFFHNLFQDSRLNYVLNMALFIDIAVVIVTGILISRTLGLKLGIGVENEFPLQLLHILSSHLSLVIVGLHVALHWKWIVTHSQKYLFNIRLPRRVRAAHGLAVSTRSRNVTTP